MFGLLICAYSLEQYTCRADLWTSRGRGATAGCRYLGLRAGAFFYDFCNAWKTQSKVVQTLQTAWAVGDASYIASDCFLANVRFYTLHFHLRPFTLAHNFRPLKISQTQCYNFKLPELCSIMRHNYRTITFAFEQSLMISRHYTNDRGPLRAHLLSLAQTLCLIDRSQRERWKR